MIWKQLWKRAAAGLAAVALVTGCGGGGGSAAGTQQQPVTQTDTGELVLTVTDAPGDFVAYLVDVTSIRLTRANGDTVETLPLTTRIDFARLSEISEFLTVATVPAGVYRDVSLTLDFSNAEIVVQDAHGDPVQADVVDAAGDPVTTLDVSLSLGDDSVIRINPATVRAFSLDFDLDASNTVDDTTTPPTVTVEPVLLAMPELEQDRRHRVRGLLASVDEPAAEVTLEVRPFRHRHGDFGRFTFQVADDAAYDIDGTHYDGAAGLAALADQPEGTPVVAHGRVVGRDLVADTVVAGTSVYWSDAEVVHGVVTARSGDSLTVSGAAVEVGDGGLRFQRELTVNVGAGTGVFAPGEDPADLGYLDISVGQRITAAGEFTDDTTLDATEGRVRLLVSRLWGDVVTVSPLVVDLHLLNGRRPEAFDFAGTGVTMAEDADPDAYEIDTATLGLPNLQPQSLVHVRGRVNGFGAAPPDFLARTVVDVADAAGGATAQVAWPGGAANPFVALAPGRLDLALDEARAVVRVHGRIRQLPITPDRLAVVAPPDGRGLYLVVERLSGKATVYRDFADLVSALTAALDGGATLHRATAHGRYNEGNGELTTVRASFVFEASGNSGAGTGGDNTAGGGG